jgi:hypothetical protein
MQGVLFYYVLLCILIPFLCIAFMQAVQKLIDEEFEGIVHLRTSTFQKRVATARHDFIKLTGAENKLEALLQVRKLLSLLSFAHTPVFPSIPGYFQAGVLYSCQRKFK